MGGIGGATPSEKSFGTKTAGPGWDSGNLRYGICTGVFTLSYHSFNYFLKKYNAKVSGFAKLTFIFSQVVAFPANPLFPSSPPFPTRKPGIPNP